MISTVWIEMATESVAKTEAHPAARRRQTGSAHTAAALYLSEPVVHMWPHSGSNRHFASKHRPNPAFSNFLLIRASAIHPY